MRSLLRILLAVAFGILLLSSVYPSTSTAQAATGPRWTQVGVDPLCFGQRIGEQSYLYNVDQDGDGVTDFAVWFHESDLVDFTDPADHPWDYTVRHRFLLDEKGRALHQWAFAWFGYQATGVCNVGGAYGNWEIRPSPGSTFNDRYLAISVQFGVADGSNFRMECHPYSGCSGAEHTVRADYWLASSGTWFLDNAPRAVLYGVVDFPFGGWSFSSTDWATVIQQGGHPAFPQQSLQYTLASTTTDPSQSVCASGAGGIPHGDLDVSDPLGTFPDGYRTRGEMVQTFFLGECWIVVNGPTAAITHSPSSPSAGQVVSFDGSRSADPNGYISSYAWDLGDGGRANGVRVNHVYARPGTYEVSLTVRDNSGLVDTARTRVTIDANLAGSVRDRQTSAPIRDVTLRAYNSAQSFAARTQADGTYRIDGIVPGWYTVEASRCDYWTSRRSVYIDGNPTTAHFDLTHKPTATLHGYVKHGGRGISGAGVSERYCWTSVSTDANGYYTMEVVAGVTLTVTAWASGYQPQWTTVSIPGGGSLRLDFHMSRDCSWRWCPV